ncbi:MAG: hypothetical protein ACLKAK_12520 [Alkaliphilus sp.]
MENLNIIAYNLSKNNFRKLPLEITGIENIENEKILVVNIYEPKSSDTMWASDFFQGTTGGTITTRTLVESFLQKDSNLESWIDGVKFTYNGERHNEFDHVYGLFSDVFYRRGD